MGEINTINVAAPRPPIRRRAAIALVGLPLLALLAAAQLGFATTGEPEPRERAALSGPVLPGSETDPETDSETQHIAPTPGALVLAGVGLLALARRRD